MEKKKFSIIGKACGYAATTTDTLIEAENEEAAIEKFIENWSKTPLVLKIEPKDCKVTEVTEIDNQTV